MKYWSGLYVETDKEKLMEGAELMLKVAKEVLASQTARQVDLLLLENGQDREGGDC